MMVTRVSVSSDDIDQVDQVTIAAIANPHYWFVRLHNPGAIRASFHLIHLFGQLCGKKRCALFIDNAIANLYEDCHCHFHCRRTNFFKFNEKGTGTGTTTIHGGDGHNGHMQWLRRHIGIALLMKEVSVVSQPYLLYINKKR